jgi:hypothetical protein
MSEPRGLPIPGDCLPVAWAAPVSHCPFPQGSLMRLKFALPVIAACVTVAAFITPAAVAAAAASISTSTATTAKAASEASADSVKPTVAYSHLDLPDGEWALVYSDGIAEVHKGGATEIQHVPLSSPDEDGVGPAGDGTIDLPSKGILIGDLAHGQAAPYAQGAVIVVYKPTVTAPAIVTANARTLAAARAEGKAAPDYTSSAGLNKVLATLGVDQATLMFPSAAQRGKFAGLQAAASKKLGTPLLDFSNAAVLHVTGASVAKAVNALQANADVEYAEPDWTVSPTDLEPARIPAADVTAAAKDAQAIRARRAETADGVPDNYTLSSSAQSMLNRPGVDAVPAFADIARKFGQLPGQGEIITNVSLGTLDDESAATNTSDPCNFYAANYGPTTIVENGQRYLDMPSMPLIPTYTASSDGTLNPAGETCGDDPELTEVGLDFSVMAPLPDQDQRAGEAGSGLTDLLGIAPGASYRLVVPSTPGGAISDVDAAFLAAAQQTPRPNVITSSLGFGTDEYGFSSRYLEDDPMTESIIASIVNTGIVVTVSAGDGLRTYTNAAISPTGGASPTNVVTNPNDTSNINDVYLSGAPSEDLDSGSIDVGGSTLNDIFAAPPNNPADRALAYAQAYPTTRYDGQREYTSGYGSRVDVAAPGDDILSFSHTFGGGPDAVTVGLEGGTSASAPETAAAAAVVLQVARLTGDKALAGSPLALRRFLEHTGTPLGPLPEAGTEFNEGPQIDIGRAVETLLTQAHDPVAPGVARVAVAQRQQESALGGTITTITDPTDISLTGIASHELITISPDWTGLSDVPGVTYSLTGENGNSLAAAPWARLYPAAILASAGLPLESTATQTVSLTYTASEFGRTAASTTFTLTFGPWDGTTPSVAPPVVPSVVTGPVIPVSYNLTGLTGATDPTLVVSYPGRIDSASGLFFNAAFSVPLTQAQGTIYVPVSKLRGAGIYGIGVQDGPTLGWLSTNLSTFTFIRVSPTGTAEPAVPTLSRGSTVGAHLLEIPYDGDFQVSYDVRNVPGATGAVAEFSAPGPTTLSNYNTFNNPNGSERDDNGYDTGSVAYVTLPGTHGTATLSGGAIGLDPTMYHVVRILATAGGHVAGQASGGSTITMDGIAPSDGGDVTNGFGIDATGDDGFLTSDGGPTTDSVETFGQSTGVTSTAVSSTTDFYETTDAACPGTLAGDTGFYTDYGTTTQTYDTLRAGVSSALDVPADVGDIICVAGNQTNDDDAVLSTYNDDLYVTPADIPAGTFGTPVNVTPALASIGFPSVGGFAENPATDTAVIAVTDFDTADLATTLVSVDLATGAVSAHPGEPDLATGVAVNPADGASGDGEALEAVESGLGFFDLGNPGSGTFVTPGGSIYEFPVAVPGTDDFLVTEVASPDYLARQPNNNAASSIDLIDSSGNVLHRYERFNFFDVFLDDTGGYIQVNPQTGTAFTLGPGGAELYPFSIGG